MSKPTPDGGNIEAQTKRWKRGNLDQTMETSKPASGQEPMDEPDAEAASSCQGGPSGHLALESCGDWPQECEQLGQKKDHVSDSSLTPASDEGTGVAGVPASSADANVVVCGRCGQPGHMADQCPFFRLAPLRHSDATSRGVGPHMNQADVSGILANTRRGTASGKRNNCLIDSLRQLLQPAAQVAQIRRALQLQFRSGAARVTANNFLQFDFHAGAIVRQLGFDPSLMTITCIDLAHRGHGDVLGRGARRLYLAREGQNHFIPLFRLAGRG